MAAAAMTAPAVDLKAPGSFNVRLGASILKDNEGKRYRNVRYNYKPRSAQGATTTSKLLPGNQANASTLLLKDENKEWKYTGRHTEGEDMYVLVLSGEGNKEVTLEKLESSHAVNLTQAPDDDDEESLAKKHPYLTDNESERDDDGMFGDEDDAEDTPPDASNPFDFRHFLKSVEEASKREEATPQPNRSTVGTPIPRAAISTPISRPTKSTTKSTPAAAAVKKRKTPSASATRPNPKRVRAGEDPPTTKQPPTSNPIASKPSTSTVPEVRIERKATIPTSSVEQHSSQPEEPDFSDDGELILENAETPTTNKHTAHLSALGGLSARGGGPISLRSAASSPGINSPQINATASQSKPESEEFEFGGEGSSPAAEQYEFEFVDDDGDDEDGDVEDLQLQSPPAPEPPRQSAVPSRSRRGSLAGPVGDDDDDMEAQLALAMAAEEDDEEPAPRLDESDEDVSEEE
ncbi:hypothetical protein MBLNU13_g02873t1 [Cladosporium sp. NU13]